MDLKTSLKNYHRRRISPVMSLQKQTKVSWWQRLKNINFDKFQNSDMWKHVSKYRKTRKKQSLPKINGRSYQFNKKQVSRSKLYKYIAIGSFVGLIFLTFAFIAVFAWYTKDLPRPDKIVRKEGFATKIYDRNDQLLYEVFSDQKRIPIKLEDISQDLRNATIATEDKNFYQHEGYDLMGYGRIIYNALLKGRIIGGSTLTQQIVKNVLLSSERTITRKMKELVLAIQIEKRYSKDEILQIYLNEAPYGGTAWGVGAAAEMYFATPPKELTLIESAILAGMPQSPTYYSPYGAHPQAFKDRTRSVLRRMREDGYISKLKEQGALSELENIKIKPQGGSIKAPHFVMYVKNILEERYGQNLVEKGGLSVTTSLDLDLHNEVQKIVTEEIAKVEESKHITNGAVVIENPQTGEILSMVGSKDYFATDYDGQFNVATSLRQPGSSIKPVTYVTALKKGFTPESLIMDVKTEFPGVSADKPYIPRNYSGKFVGPTSLREALGNSLNIPAVKLLALVGVKDMMQTGYEMGLPSFKPSQKEVNRLGLSVTLGGGEVKLLDLVTAYSTFANEGYHVEPLSILKVVDRKGKVLEENKPHKGKQVLSAGQAFLISHMLSDNSARQLTFGLNSLLNIPSRTIAVKTGTTNDLRDNWAIGWDPQAIVGVWVGNNDNSKMSSVASGISGATPIWRKSITSILEGKPVMEFKMPSDVESISLDEISGYPSHDDFPTKESLIIRGTQPTGKDPIHVKLKLCKDDHNKLAPTQRVVRGDYDEKEYFIFKADDPSFGNADNHWQKAIDDWVSKQSDERYHPPTEYCDDSQAIGIAFETPRDHDKKDNNNFDLKVRIGLDGDLDRVEFYANNNRVGEVKNEPYKVHIHLDDGTYELKAKAFDKKGHSSDATIRIGVKQDWDYNPPAPTPTPTPSVAPTPTASPSAGLIKINIS